MGEGHTPDPESAVARLTERVRMLEAELAVARVGESMRAASEGRLTLFAEAMTDVIWTSDLYFRWNWMSPSVELLLGYTPEECLKLTPADTLTPASLAVATANLEAGLKVIFADRSLVRWPHDMEIEQIRKDGSTVWTEVRVTVMRTPDGTPYGYLGVTRDISKRKAAEDALRDLKTELERRVEERTRELAAANAALAKSEARFRAMNDHAANIVSIIDRNGVAKYQSPSSLRIIGYAPEELVGRAVWDFVHPDDAPAVTAAIARLFAAPDSVERLEYRYRHKDGRWLTLESTGSLMPDWWETGEIIVHTSDVTERRRLEAEAARIERLESVGLLAGGIAHDFNNILTVLFGNLSLARRMMAPGDPSHARLARAETACARARDLTSQLLTFSRGGSPVRRAASLAEVIRQSAEFTLSGANVRAEFALAPDLHTVRVDVTQMSRVIQNLLLNARDAMPGGGTVTVRAANAPTAALPWAPIAGPAVVVSVEDQGPGVPHALRPRIFDPYFTTKEAGHGLGLAVAHSIVTRHDGFFAVDDAPGGGARFRFALPAAPEETPEPAEEPAGDGGALRGRLLVMDDEPGILAALVETAAKLGLEADGAADGDRAAEALARALAEGRPYDVAILDLTVRGGSDGIETARRLRALDRRCVLVVSSGYSDDPVLAGHLAHGFDDILPKPWLFDTVEAVLRRALARRALTAGAGVI